jgi:oligopeptide transport system substrate-binding protein
MRSWLIRLFIVVVILVAALLFHEHRQHRERRCDVAAKNKILLAGNGAEIETLDPHLATGVPEHKVISALFEGLVAPAADNPDADAPGAAASWTHDAQHRVWTFTLQPNGRWSDGLAVTAQDFVYSYQRILSPDIASDYGEMLYPMEGAQEYHQGKLTDFAKVGARALDERTLEITLKGPTPYFLGMLKHYTWFPVPRHVIEKHGGMTKRDPVWTKQANIVSNGPFKLKTWRYNHFLAVDRNPMYWDAAVVRLNEIHFFPIGSDATEERAFQNGQLHLTNTVPLPRTPYYSKEEPRYYRPDPILGCNFYRFNTTKPPFNDVRVRRALALAVDRQVITEKVLRAGQIPAAGLTPPKTAVGYTTPLKLSLDLITARRLLSEAGYPEGKGFPSFEILINTSEAHRSIAEAIQEMWNKNLGIPAKILNQDWQVYLNSMRNLDYAVCRAGWLGDYPDPLTFLSIWRTGDGNNNTGWSNATYDKLVNESSLQSDPTARMSMLMQAESLLLDELPLLPIYWQVHAYLAQPGVKNLLPSVLEHRCYKAIDL